MLLFLLLIPLCLSLPTDCPYFTNPDRPLVLSHRGACGILPEHSAAAYSTAYYEGTDFDEPDLQVTKDGVLVISHNPFMKETTNIDTMEQFHDRRVNLTFIGKQNGFVCENDYLINDFTWDELVQSGVKLRNRYASRNPFYNDMFPIMRFEEAIELLIKLNKEAPREGRKFKTGLYVETKMVQWYKEFRDVDIAKLVYDVLVKYDLHTVKLASEKLPIILESFEEDSLHYFETVTDLPRIQLMHEEKYFKYNLTHISTYAHGVGPNFKYLFNQTGETFNLDETSQFIEKCHELELKVHPWVMQDDFLQFTKNSIDENMVYVNKGVDGMFTEFPETTLQTYLLQEDFQNRIKKKVADSL